MIVREVDFTKLDVCHRHHEAFEAKSILELEKIMRWSFFRTILMMPSDSSPQIALEFAIIGSKKLVSR